MLAYVFQSTINNSFHPCPNSTSRNARPPTRSCSPASGIAPCPPTAFTATSCIKRHAARDSSRHSAATVRDSPSPCATPARTAACPSTADASTERTSSAAYHGWQFDAHNGQCQLIPSLTADQNLKVDRIYAGSYACEEHDSFIWVFIPDPAPPGAGFTKPAEAPDAAPQIEKFTEKYKLAYLTPTCPSASTTASSASWIPRTAPSSIRPGGGATAHSIHEKKKNFEPIPNGFRMSAHTPSSNSAPYKLLRLYADADSITTTIDFVLPNLRTETIRAGKYWFSSLTTVTPITRNHCRIDVVAAWNLFRWMPFGPELLKFVFAKFVEQDRRTMELQAEGLKHNPHLMLIDDADRPAKWYFQLKAAYLEAKRTGEAMKHPMPGPVTLKWRS